MKKIRFGIIGCGKISDAYFTGGPAYDVLELAACADMDPSRSGAKAAQHGVRAMSVAELLSSPDVDLIVNLTVPSAHAEINLAALRAGKHAYCEKPFAITPADGAAVLALARSKGLLVGCAPDTFLGGGQQNARACLDSGALGESVAATGFMLCHGHEHWHPSPQFYYERGGGPMFDMGPYYLTALVNLLGPAAAVSAAARASFPERLITSQPLAGQRIPVRVSTHYSASVRFAGGAIATLVMSFDAWPGPALPPLMLFGSKGTIEIPDPNRFDGVVRVWGQAGGEPGILEAKDPPWARGKGVADMAYSILRPGRPMRASGELAQHVLEIMAACDQSAASGREVALATTCARPAALPPGLPPNTLDP